MGSAYVLHMLTRVAGWVLHVELAWRVSEALLEAVR